MLKAPCLPRRCTFAFKITKHGGLWTIKSHLSWVLVPRILSNRFSELAFSVLAATTQQPVFQARPGLRNVVVCWSFHAMRGLSTTCSWKGPLLYRFLLIVVVIACRHVAAAGLDVLFCFRLPAWVSHAFHGIAGAAGGLRLLLPLLLLCLLGLLLCLPRLLLLLLLVLLLVTTPTPTTPDAPIPTPTTHDHYQYHHHHYYFCCHWYSYCN